MISRRFAPRFMALSTVVSGILCVATAGAHITLTEPAPRSLTDEQKISPCGGVERGEPTEFDAGSTITVKWNDTISHPGWYTVSFDPTGDDFDGDGDGTADFPAQSVDTAGEFSNGDGSLVLMTDIDTVEYNGNRPAGEHEVEVTLPSEPCDECTLQLIQVMDDSGHAPSAMRPTGHIYFRCADIRLVAPAGEPPMGNGGMGNIPEEPDAGPQGPDETETMGPTGSEDTEGMTGMTGEEPVVPDPIVPPMMTMTPPAQTTAPAMTMPPVMMPTPPAASSTPSSMPAPEPTSSGTTAPTAPAPTMSTGAAAADDDGGDEGGCALQGNGAASNSGTWAILGALLALALGRRARS